jgi:hypothetical protein
MPRPKKKSSEYTTEETMKKLFPKKARDRAKKEAENPRSPAKTDSMKQSKQE